MSKLPKKKFSITSNQNPSPEESLKNLGSFRLRFKTGSTVKQAQKNATADSLGDSPQDSLELFTTLYKEQTDTVQETPLVLSSDHPVDNGLTDPEVSIVDIYKATPSELRKYSYSSEDTQVNEAGVTMTFKEDTITEANSDEDYIVRTEPPIITEIELSEIQQSSNVDLIEPIESPPPYELIEEENADLDDSFQFLPPEEEPVLTEDFQERAVRSITTVVVQESKKKSLPKCNCCQKVRGCCNGNFFTSKKSKTQLSPETHVASKQGFAMMRKLVYPGMPKVFQDLWVFTELAVTIVQLVLAAITLAADPSNVFNIVYVSITAVAFPLALFDSFLHFITLGSLASTIRYFKNKHKSKLGKTPDNASTCWSPFSAKTKQQILDVLDFVRNWVTDILLYPLVVLDLYDLLSSELYLLQTTDDQINFSLFIISVVFLILSVYLTRLVMIVTAAINFRRVPSDLSGSHKKIVKMSLWFLLHVLGQIIIHALIFVSLGVNIYLENTQFNNIPTYFPQINFSSPVATSSTLNTSGFLIFSAVAGLFITQLGLVSFFFVNYYHVRELSISFWVDMISMLQSENFASLVFQKGISTAKKRTQEMAQSIKLKKVKENLATVKAVPLYVKLLYPFRIPWCVVIGMFYCILLGLFIIFLSITCIPVSGTDQFVCSSFLDSPSLYSIPYFCTVVLLILANSQVILMVSLWVVILIVFLALIAIGPILLVVFIALYVPLGCVALCVLFFYDLGREMNVFSTPGEKISRLRKEDLRRTVKKELFAQ